MNHRVPESNKTKDNDEKRRDKQQRVAARTAKNQERKDKRK